MRAIVCGGRDFEDYGFLRDFLDVIAREHGIDMVIEGGADGADALARRWARDRATPRLTVPADWYGFGRQAGPKRNAEMLTHAPDIVIAFPGGRGTADMVNKARAAGIQVVEVERAGHAGSGEG